MKRFQTGIFLFRKPNITFWLQYFWRILSLRDLYLFKVLPKVWNYVKGLCHMTFDSGSFHRTTFPTSSSQAKKLY
jgi:hypothetical protein